MIFYNHQISWETVNVLRKHVEVSSVTSKIIAIELPIESELSIERGK